VFDHLTLLDDVMEGCMEGKDGIGGGIEGGTLLMEDWSNGSKKFRQYSITSEFLGIETPHNRQEPGVKTLRCH
jgi:hypothetical protein